jgi:hypothetical protein
VGRQTEANQERLKIELISGDELTTATNQEDPPAKRGAKDSTR